MRDVCSSNNADIFDFFLIYSLPMDKILRIGTVTSKLLENFMTVFIRLKIYQA